jgi:hypothetical protein
MIHVIDTASSQWNLDFAVAYAEGFRAVYVKMGGDNVDTYVAPWYTRQIDRARAAGFADVGHYWVPDANPNDPDTVDTPTQQADWMIDRLHDWRPSDFIVLDNESLDGAFRFSDVQAAEFIERVKSRLKIPGCQVLTYTGWYDGAGIAWQATLATGTNFIVADYRAGSQPPMGFPDIPSIPRERIVGHQYGGRAIGGVITDTNVFVDTAFDYDQEETDMGSLEGMLFVNIDTNEFGVIESGRWLVIPDGDALEAYKAAVALNRGIAEAEVPELRVGDKKYKSFRSMFAQQAVEFRGSFG